MLIEIKTFHSVHITMSYHPYDNRENFKFRQIILPTDVSFIKHTQGGWEARTNIVEQMSCQDIWKHLRKKSALSALQRLNKFAHKDIATRMNNWYSKLVEITGLKVRQGVKSQGNVWTFFYFSLIWLYDWHTLKPELR